MTKTSSFLAKILLIILKIRQGVEESKKHNLVFKIAVPGLKNGDLFIFFLNSHLVVGTGPIQLDKTLGPT